MNYKETDDIWRLYHREWVVVHTVPQMKLQPGSSQPAEEVYKRAQAWATDNLVGRLRDEDIKIVLHTDNVDMIWGVVEAHKDTLKGEFKYVEAAQQHAVREKYDEYVIVPRNSKSDQDIRNYGVVKL